jgi:propionyl-CoA carboxylase alpha chain
LDSESPSNQSYLLGDKIIEVAKSWVDAIHPGMGFE